MIGLYLRCDTAPPWRRTIDIFEALFDCPSPGVWRLRSSEDIVGGILPLSCLCEPYDCVLAFDFLNLLTPLSEAFAMQGGSYVRKRRALRHEFVDEVGQYELFKKASVAWNSIGYLHDLLCRCK